jgi:acyl-coenzyme A thioesterase PaaI-like protein
MSTSPDVRDRWFPQPGTEPPAYAAKHRIAEHVRAMIERLVGLDVDALGDAELAALEKEAAGLRQHLESLPDRRRDGSLAAQPPPEGRLVERSPVSGRGNALALPLTYDFDAASDTDKTHAWAVFSTSYEGPPGGVHGGYVAAAFDELLGVAQMVTGVAGFTGTLTVRYRELTPVGRRIDFTAWPADRDGRKVTMQARATCDDTIVAEAEGLFIAQVAAGEVPGADPQRW